MIFMRFGFSVGLTFLVFGAVLGRAGVADHRWLAIAIGAVVLWGVSGAIAMRLVRPLWRVAKVARDIGDGDLSSRVDLSWRTPGEIGDLAIAINHMAERIEQQVADQRALFAAVSHEIRTPLGHMRVLTELARDGDPARLTELEAEIESVNSLVDKLLASSRLDFDSLTVRQLDAVEFCLLALERADMDAALLEIDRDDNQLMGDATLLTRAVGNLIENASRHADALTEIRLSGDSEMMRISVSDRGPGFADSAEDVKIERFTRGANPKDGSLGLGLSLVQRIVQAHGGALQIENIDGGARVTLELPLSGAETENSHPA